MPAPNRVEQWIKERYPKPEIDTQWLEECYTYIQSQPAQARGNLSDAMQQVEAQYLASDLRDSAVPRTALPINFKELASARLKGPFLVQIVALTDIGHSAFSLQNTRQIRIEREDTSAPYTSESDGEDEGPIPNYPRGMLRFELSDGFTVIPAIEYRKIPEFQLGVTPLGCKLVLKDFLVRKGIAFLEPSSVVFKGSLVEELEASQDSDFVKSLRRRLGKPEESENPEATLPVNQIPEGGHNNPSIQPAVPGRQVGQPTIVEDEDEEERSLLNARPDLEFGPSSLSGVPSEDAAVTIESPYFSKNIFVSDSTHVTSTAMNLQLSNLSARSVRATTKVGNTLLDSSSDAEFRMHSDEMDVDFLAELDDVEARALGTSNSQLSNRPLTQTQEVIDVEDSSDKENIPALSQIRAITQRRLPIPTDGIIDISD